MRNIEIISSGSYLPKIEVNNQQLEKELKLEEGYIEKRTGVEKRYYAKEETIEKMAKKAVQNLLEKLEIQSKSSNLNELDDSKLKEIIQQIGLIIVATTTPNYLMPGIANKIQKDKPILQSILLVPTRELALQLYQCCKIFFKNFPEVKISCLMGGQESQKDIEKLNVTPQILIGTPERIQHIVIDNGLLNLSTVSTLIIDEADMTLEMGFLNEVDRIASLIHPQAQIMVFSATIPVGIRPFLKKYLKNPILIEDDKSSDHENIEHILYPSKERNIYDIL